MVLYKLIIHFDNLKSAGSEILVKTVGAINNFNCEGWSQLFSPISRNRQILGYQNVLLAYIKPPPNITKIKLLVYLNIRSMPFTTFSPNPDISHYKLARVGGYFAGPKPSPNCMKILW